MAYRIVRQLPSGGFSDVFEVEDAASALPERLVLKRLNAAMSALPQVRAAFAAEAQLLRDLKYPHVVTFRRCYYDEQQQICLLMEKVPGEPLDAWARRHVNQQQLLLDLFELVLLAVDYLHHRATPFLHLDLKPDNVLVVTGRDGPHPVLIDFGIARRAGEPGLKAYTPPYGSPEQERGGRLSTASDVHALGQILADLLALMEPAPPGTTPQRVAAQRVAALRQVAAKAASAEPRRRYADAGEMRLAFRRARATLSPARSSVGAARPRPAATTAAAPWQQGWRGRPRRWLAAAAGGAAALVAGSLALLAPGSGGGGAPETAAVQGAAAEQPQSSRQNEAAARFSRLQFRFEESVLQERCSLTDPEYLALRDLANAAPAAEGGWMYQALDGLRHQCQAIERHDAQSREVLSELREKHLLRGP